MPINCGVEMLKQIYKSAPFQYYTRATFPDFFLLNLDFHANIDPWIEKVYDIVGLYMYGVPTLNGETSVYLQCALNASYWPGWGVGLERFDGVTGAFIERISIAGSIGNATINGIFRSTGGKLWTKSFWSDTISSSDGQSFFVSYFEGLPFFGVCAIDEESDTFLNSTGADVSTYRLSTGKFITSYVFPNAVKAIATEDSSHVYVLLVNRILVLFDFVNGGVLGFAKTPPPPGGSKSSVGPVAITWDYLYRRILIAEKVPDNADGSSATCVRGYRLVPQPVRITTPIPLKAPRKYRQIPVLAQVVGDMNEGVGGYLVSSTVTGDGKLVGIPITDNIGRAITQIACGNVSGTFTPPSGSTGSTLLAPVIGRYIWFGYFYQYSEKYGDNPTAPSNATLVGDVQSVATAVAAGKKIVVSGDAINAALNYLDQVIGVYASGGSPEALQQDAASVRASLPSAYEDIPILGVFDGGQDTISGPVSGVDIMGLEVYVGASETAEEAEARVRGVLNTMPGTPVVLIGDSYTSNTNNTQDPDTLMKAQVIPANIAKDYPQVVGIFMFSDGRPTGTRDHEEWRPIHRAILAGISGVSTTVDQQSAAPLPPGNVRIVCSVTPPNDPVLAIPSGGVTTVPDTSGGTSDDAQTPSLPPQAPNRMDILQQVLASKTWHLSNGDAYDQTQPDGRGAFTEAAVAALHAADDRFGHVKKNPGQNQYNGHAVDAIDWKNPDGVTAEVYDILDGSGNLQWGFQGRDANALSLWYFA